MCPISSHMFFVILVTIFMGFPIKVAAEYLTALSIFISIYIYILNGLTAF